MNELYIPIEPCKSSNLLGTGYDESARVLAVIDHNGIYQARTSVHLHPGDIDSRPKGSACATWMPYQQAQAKAQGDVGTTARAVSVLELPVFDQIDDAKRIGGE